MVTQASDKDDSLDQRPVVFYDGDCPLCRREIDHYRRVDRALRVRWVDAASETDSLRDFGLTLNDAMAELHVLDEAGQWQRGVDAFLVIWDHLPRYRWLTALVRGLRLRSPLTTRLRPDNDALLGIPKTGGQATTLLTRAVLGPRIALSRDHIYWVQRPHKPIRIATIMRVHKRTAQIETVASNQYGPTGMVVVEKSLFWANSGELGQRNGTLSKLRINP